MKCWLESGQRRGDHTWAGSKNLFILKREREKSRIQGKQDGRGESGRLDDRHLLSSLTSRLHTKLQEEKACVFLSCKALTVATSFITDKNDEKCTSEVWIFSVVLINTNDWRCKMTTAPQYCPKSNQTLFIQCQLPTKMSSYLGLLLVIDNWVDWFILGLIILPRANIWSQWQERNYQGA